jgi:metallophosphoesterase superfamily enzyme
MIWRQPGSSHNRLSALLEPERLTVALGDEWVLTPERAAVHRPTATAVIADLHLGYDHARRAVGDAVPFVDFRHGLTPLESLFAYHRVESLVVAGDVVESYRCGGFVEGLADWLAERKVRLAGIVPGNHDRGLPTSGPVPFFPDGFTLERWRVVHGDAALPRGPVVHGHLHPCFRWGRRVIGSCYLFRGDRLIIPCFADATGGLNVRGVRRWKGYRCCVVAGSKVLDFGDVSELGES